MVPFTTRGRPGEFVLKNEIICFGYTELNVVLLWGLINMPETPENILM